MQTNTHGMKAVGTALALAVTLLLGTDVVRAQAPAGEGKPEVQAAPEAAQGQMMKGQAGMMAERAKMMTDMRAMDEKLAGLIATMKAAKGDGKIDAIAAVVEEMAVQRTRMHQHMAAMHDNMMSMMKMGKQ